MPFCAFGQNRVVKVFSCEINGRPVFGDTLPKECYGRAWVQKINGVVVYREEAQPSPEESAKRREQAIQQKLAKEEADRQKRHRDALLERYSSLEALDQRSAHELAELDKAIDELRTNEKRLVERRKSFDDEEAKASGDKPVSPDLKRAIAYADEELAQARKAIERKVTERENLRQRFEEDRRYYIEITSHASDSPRTTE
ncbi:MAG: hypothetical protein LBG78_06890 [Azoarcus sp.]|nr:hypothetical protein [Azoarcus sp.]